MVRNVPVIKYVQTIFVVCIFWYFVSASLTPAEYRFMDTIDLIFHEAGHFIFFFFGSFVQMAGGMIMQLLVPSIVFVHLFRTGQRYSAYLSLFWLGQSFVNASVYAGDAQTMALPLLGGDSVTHDWNYMLSSMGMLEMAPVVSTALITIGVTVYVIALYGAVREVWGRW